MSDSPTNDDKRSVTTDALTTLGTLIGPNEKRDAIHLAVEPVVAGCYLEPGDHITVRDGRAYRCKAGTGLGIVDPFLLERIEVEQRFWFIMYPRQVRSLRHVWSHPAFPDEVAAGAPIAKAPDKAASEAWLRDFCQRSDCPCYETVMGCILDGNQNTHDDDYLHFDGQDAHADIPDLFWDHVEIVTGKTFKRAKWFSCAC